MYTKEKCPQCGVLADNPLECGNFGDYNCPRFGVGSYEQLALEMRKELDFFVDWVKQGDYEQSFIENAERLIEKHQWLTEKK
jgi:hypothetical protein